jgi:hypothetical protein
MILMAEILAALTPENIQLLVWLGGAFVIGSTSLIGMFWLGDSLDRWF